jgi:hypothetical protein
MNMVNTLKAVNALGMLEDINYGGCGLAALIIAKAVKADGLTPVFWMNSDCWEHMDHVVVEIAETKRLLEAGSTEASSYWAQYQITEAELRKAIRNRRIWNRQFDRRTLRMVKSYVL